MVEAVLDEWSSVEALLECAPAADDDLWWPSDEVLAGHAPEVGPELARLSEEQPRLSEVAPSGFSALELDWTLLILRGSVIRR